ncbi:hypothetical protein [Streptomyces qinzhouensis]|uniref:Uncharacterized protein n=1 Tax=Streptomyces qinzhouensis TaxID=2599401 RepID=A0A5B8J938_9ACTN|nr:hypothetical protein [Streptomyces qinzhouensis]QDY76391.1 hypothetical protein FQU76_07395 [Streptomyces qinzhouensis]
MTNSSRSPASRDLEFTLAQLRGDCARMAPHWTVPAIVADAPVPPSRIHGVVVSADSARLVRGMTDN